MIAVALSGGIDSAAAAVALNEKGEKMNDFLLMLGGAVFVMVISGIVNYKKSQWVELTEDDKVLIKHDANFNQFMTAGEYADRVQALTEARLKDKNT